MSAKRTGSCGNCGNPHARHDYCDNCGNSDPLHHLSEARVAELERECVRLRGDPNDEDERGSVYWFGEAQRWKSLASQITTDWIPANQRLSDRIATLEAECRGLREIIARALPHVQSSADASHMMDGFRPRVPNSYDRLADEMRDAARTSARGGEGS